jgi:hypothetical protein
MSHPLLGGAVEITNREKIQGWVKTLKQEIRK